METFFQILGAVFAVSLIWFLIEIKLAPNIDEDDVLMNINPSIYETYEMFVSEPIFGENPKIAYFVKWSLQNTPYKCNKLDFSKLKLVTCNFTHGKFCPFCADKF